MNSRCLYLPQPNVRSQPRVGIGRPREAHGTFKTGNRSVRVRLRVRPGVRNPKRGAVRRGESELPCTPDAQAHVLHDVRALSNDGSEACSGDKLSQVLASKVQPDVVTFPTSNDLAPLTSNDDEVLFHLN